MSKIIILNGPPGCGKDTLGAEIEGVKGWEKVSFKEPMFRIAREMLGEAGFRSFMLSYGNREQKERPQSFLGGKSPREFMIWISEDVIKPVFGNQHFGKLFNERLKRGCDYICTDGGFPDEVETLLLAGHEIELVRLHRSGFTFEGDSRNYITITWAVGQNCGYREFDIALCDGEIEEAVVDILEAIDSK